MTTDYQTWLKCYTANKDIERAIRKHMDGCFDPAVEGFEG